ncbi:MAG: FAD-binding oxidoreductase [Rhizobiales bacterium]|nr:FAD-binding oxidoreductase [Hyphomicrobiales bacterium]
MDLLTINDRQGCYPGSYYAASATPLARFPAAAGALSADVCVIGGGYTGLSAALHLREKGFDVVLLEAQRVGFGASGRNGGQVAPGQRADQTVLEKMVGRDAARGLFDLSLASVALVRDLVARHDIDCHWADGIVRAMHRARYVPEIHSYAARLARDYGYDGLEPLDRAGIRALVGSQDYHGGALERGGGHLHPLRFALGLARAAREAGVRVFEGSTVTDFTEGSQPVVRTAEAEIRARHVLLACNGYLGRLSGAVAKRVMPINNFIVATEPLSETAARALIRDNHAVADSRFVVNYFRLSADRRLLFGGGESYGYRFPANLKEKARGPMLNIFPHLSDTKIDYAWGGTLAITRSRMPDFARLSPTVLSVSGYSGHGVALATLGGKLAAEAIAGDASGFDLMARVPTPTFPGGTLARAPLLVLAMLWYSFRDRF